MAVGLVALVRRTLLEERLVERGMRVLAACSGGPDSAAMLAALAQLAPELGFELEAASIDHGLRASAAADLALARTQASHVRVPFHALQIAVGTGPSVQARARRERYAALHALAAERGAQRIAVAHTRDDQAETVLQRLLRGASVRGLAAIELRRADGVIRPLLQVARADAHAFARASFEGIADDPSNRDPRFTRVRVRSELLPLLEREDPAIAVHLADLAADAREYEALLEAAAVALLRAAQLDPETLTISALCAAPRLVRRAALRAWLRSHACPAGRAHLRDLDEACVRGRGEVWLTASHAAIVQSDGVLRLTERPAPETSGRKA